MNNYPCSEMCITYAMCRQRDTVGKYEVCSIFRDYVISTIEETQTEMDEEHGKGKLTVVGVRLNYEDLIDKKGNLISGKKKERIYV